MAGIEDMFSSTMIAVPILVIAVIGVIMLGVMFAYKQRIGPFYWRDSIRVKFVENITSHGSEIITNDKLRKTDKGGVMYFESYKFKDKFPAEQFIQEVTYHPGRKFMFFPSEIATIGRLGRFKPNVWDTIETKVSEEQKAHLNYVFPDEAKYASALMEQDVKNFLTDDWLSKYAPLIAAVIIGVICLLCMVVSIQYISAVTNGHLSAMNGQVEAMNRIANTTWELCVNNSRTYNPPPPG